MEMAAEDRGQTRLELGSVKTDVWSEARQPTQHIPTDATHTTAYHMPAQDLSRKEQEVKCTGVTCGSSLYCASTFYSAQAH
jgi:hypothetical protein